MNYTPIKSGAAADSRIVNRPLAQLSAVIAAKALAYSLVRDVKATATAPQNLDTSWQKREFTEITSDDDGNISAIASNTDIQIARAGTYCCLASAPALSSSGGLRHKVRLHSYHSDDGSNAYVYGTSAHGFTTVVKRSFLFARLELVAGDYVSLQHRGDAACAGGAAYGTDDEIYSMLILWREGALGNYFTPVPVDAAGLAATINSRLASLDAAVSGAMLRQFIYCREEQTSGTAGGD